MDPVSFPLSNVTFAKDQPEYLPLPAHVSKDGTVTTCWRLTLKERLRVLFGGNIWLQVLTFNQPLQPQRPSAEMPLEEVPNV